MKLVKMIGLLAIAAAAMTAFAATASATTLTSPTGTVYTGAIKAESSNSSLHGSFITVSCSSSKVEGSVEQHGAAKTVAGKISALSFSGCNYTVTVLNKGSLELHAVSCDKKTNYCTGTLTSTGAEILIHTSVGECVFTTTNTHIGTVTGTDDTKGHAVLDIDSAGIPRTGGSFFCGSSGEWTGSYTVTSPSSLWIDA